MASMQRYQKTYERSNPVNWSSAPKGYRSSHNEGYGRRMHGKQMGHAMANDSQYQGHYLKSGMAKQQTQSYSSNHNMTGPHGYNQGRQFQTYRQNYWSMVETDMHHSQYSDQEMVSGHHHGEPQAYGRTEMGMKKNRRFMKHRDDDDDDEDEDEDDCSDDDDDDCSDDEYHSESESEEDHDSNQGY